MRKQGANAFPVLEAATGGAAAYFWIAAALNVIGIGCCLNMRFPGRDAPAPALAAGFHTGEV